MKSKVYENVIWEGRYQPTHMGHLSYIKELLKYSKHLTLFVVDNEISTNVIGGPENSPVPDFTREVDKHHVPEKNPLPFWLRLRLLQETVKIEFPEEQITVWGGRRLDLMWPFYKKNFPPNRIFLTPTRDSFEDSKANAWIKLGEKMDRIDVSHLPIVSGTMIREKVKNCESVEGLIHPTTKLILEETGFYEKLGQL